ncbi:MAG: sugar ABC transporter permease [Bacillota bacterium]|nr:sugar ABC transporter permease [Bacillota bacterium]HHT91859.1 sugar ABC transporter permease [Bacillota bacterium]
MKIEHAKLDKKAGLRSLAKIDFRSSTIVLALLVLWVILSVLTDGAFLTPRNLSNLFRQGSVVAFIAVGMVMVIAAGQIDLSAGSLAGLAGAMAALAQVRWLPALAEQTGIHALASGWLATIVAVLVAVGMGILLGGIQGVWVAYGQVPAFIVTLGGSLIFRGWLLGLTRGVNIAPMDPKFQQLGQAYVSPALGTWLGAVAVVLIVVFTVHSRMNKKRHGFDVRPLWLEAMIAGGMSVIVLWFVSNMNRFRGIPVPVMMLLALAGLFTFITTRTQFGRYVYAIGGNIEAARLSGINIRRNILKIFMVVGAMAGVSGAVLTARLNVATANAGAQFELNAIAACVIGGTSLVGGEGSIPGALVGALIMATVDNGMSLMNVESFWQQIIKGMILATAVLIDVNTRKARA